MPSSVRRVLLASAVALAMCITTLASEPASQPSSAPATSRPAAETPRQALRQWLQAMARGEGHRVAELSCAGTDPEKRLNQMFADYADAFTRLKEAVRAKFGAAAVEKLGPSPIVAMLGTLEPLAKDLEKLDKAPEQIEGDKATITVDGQSTRLEKVDGTWRVSLASMMSDASPQSVQMFGGIMKSWIGTLNAMAEEVKAGEFDSVEAVRRELNN